MPYTVAFPSLLHVRQAALLVSQPGLCAGWRRLLLSPSPHLPLLREAAWLAAFCSAGGGAEAAAAMAGGGGLLPGLLLATMRCVRQAVSAHGETGSAGAAAVPQALPMPYCPCYGVGRGRRCKSFLLRVLDRLYEARPEAPSFESRVSHPVPNLAC